MKIIAIQVSRELQTLLSEMFGRFPREYSSMINVIVIAGKVFKGI